MNMLLAADIGNSQTVFGLFDNGELRADWRISTRRQITSDELGVLLRSLFAEADLDHESVDGIIVSSVVPHLNGVFTTTSKRYFSCEPMFVGPGIKSGMPILYENPHEVGADRIVNSVAAIARYGAPVIVLDFGTATTFDVVGPGGEYLGGVIAPGPGVSAEALFDKAARLHHVDVRAPQRVIGRSTEQSMQSGLFFGYVALVEGMVRRIRAELNVDAPVVATGGLASVFEPELTFLQEVNPQLTLEGLWLLWEKNRK
jgi:type III pantothenate kinase